jgi:hypothetical protein
VSAYEPELGQAVFGQPYKKHAVSQIVDAALRLIRDRLGTVMWNIHHQDYASPFGNTGESFKCETFEVCAYSWSREEQPFNFKWRDVEISWYKYLGRGMSANMEIPPALAAEMLDDCLAAIERYDDAEKPA